MHDSRIAVKSGRPARLLRYTLIALLAAVGTGLGIYAGPWFKPRAQIHAALDTDCDLRAGPCTSPLSDGRAIRFSIEPRSIPPLVPLLLRVDTLGFSAEKVDVDLNGVGMYMGYNRISLSPVADGHFSATASLSVCIRSVMEWEARVTIEGEDAQITAPFRFITVKDGLQP